MKGICPAALGSKDQQPASFDPNTGHFYVPTNHVCMDYEPFEVEYVAGQPYVGATLSMFPAPNGHGGMGNFITWDAGEGKIVQSKAEKFSVWSGALNTAGGISCFGTLEGYLKCVDKKDSICSQMYFAWYVFKIGSILRMHCHRHHRKTNSVYPLCILF